MCQIATIPVMLLFGQTAIGKTELLFNLFSNCSSLSLLSGCAEVVNADSVQVYCDAKVCSAMPDDYVLSSLKHHLVAFKTPFEEFSVSDFVNEADRIVPCIYNGGENFSSLSNANNNQRRKLPVIAGGTAFFIKNFIYGLPSTPTANQQTRQFLQERLKNEGINILYEELKKIDIKTAMRLNINDEYRIVRALEVFYDSGITLSDYPLSKNTRSLYKFLPIYLIKKRESLYEKIEKRVDEMGKALKAEFLSIYEACKSMHIVPDLEHVPLFRAIGYKEFFDVNPLLPHLAPIEDVISLIKRNTKRYAKRQETFFKKIDGTIKIDMDEEGWFKKLHEKVVDFYEENCIKM